MGLTLRGFAAKLAAIVRHVGHGAPILASQRNKANKEATPISPCVAGDAELRKAIERLLDSPDGIEDDHAWYDDTAPQVSIIIPNWNRSEMTLQCVRQLRRHTHGYRYEIIVVDNGSRSEEVARLRMEGGLRLIALARNKYFGEANNIGAEAAKGEYVCFLNNDAFVGTGWLAPLMHVLLGKKDAGGVGPKFVYPDGRLQEAGGFIAPDGSPLQRGRHGDPGDPSFNEIQSVDYISAATFIIRKEIFIRVLGFDLCWEPAYYEDADLCFKIRELGYKIYYVPSSTVTHIENATSADPGTGMQLHNAFEINKTKFVAKWKRDMADPGAQVREFAYGTAKGPLKRRLNSESAKRVAFFTPFDITPRGGERFLLTMAAALAGTCEIALITPDPCSRCRVSTMGKELELDLSDLRRVTLEESLASNWDIAFVLGNHTAPAIRGFARTNVYVCQFPLPSETVSSAAPRTFWPGYDKVLVYSDNLRTYLKREVALLSLRELPIEVLPPPVRLHNSRGIKKESILSVGGFSWGEHRQDLLIKVFKALAKGSRGALEFHLAGALDLGPESREYFLSLVQAAKGLPVYFHPNCGPAELSFLYETSRLYWPGTGLGSGTSMVPGKAEGVRVSVLEAMSAGCVPIVDKEGSLLEYVEHGRNGLTFRDADELGVLSRQLLEDETQRMSLAEEAVACAREYSEENFMHKVAAMVELMETVPH